MGSSFQEFVLVVWQTWPSYWKRTRRRGVDGRREDLATAGVSHQYGLRRLERVIKVKYSCCKSVAEEKNWAKNSPFWGPSLGKLGRGFWGGPAQKPLENEWGFKKFI